MFCDKPHLISFPYELQFNILHFLDPLDILSIQKTCKRMYHIAKDRRLWVNMLKNVCEKNSVFLPTYPFEKMSFEELKWSATSPDRFLLFAETHKPGQELDATKEWEIHDIPGLEDTRISSIYLVPGGRYLFIFSPESIFLWDIDHRPLRPLATLEHLYDEYVISTTVDGLGLRIVLIELSVDGDDDRSSLKVFDIYPLSPKPEFVNIATLDYPGFIEVLVLSVYDDFVVFLDGCTVKVWNFIAQKATLWRVSDLFCQMIVTETTVSMISRNGIFGWRIPKLTSEPSALYSQGVDELLPDYGFEFKRPFSDDDAVQFCGPCDWYTKTKQNLLIDIASCVPNPASSKDTEAWMWSLCRFQLNPNKAPDDDILDWDMPSPVQEYHLGPSSKTIGFEPYRFCNSKLIALWQENIEVDPDNDRYNSVTKIHIGASSGPLSEEAGNRYILIRCHSFAPGWFSFCPVAGRVCYVMYTDDADTYKIGVYDFIN